MRGAGLEAGGLASGLAEAGELRPQRVALRPRKLIQEVAATGALPGVWYVLELGAYSSWILPTVLFPGIALSVLQSH